MPSRDVTPFRVLNLSLSFSVVLAPVVLSVLPLFVDGSTAVVTNALVALFVAHNALQYEPRLRASPVFDFGVVTFAGFLAGRAVGWLLGFPWDHAGISVLSWLVAVALGVQWFARREVRWTATTETST